MDSGNIQTRADESDWYDHIHSALLTACDFYNAQKFDEISGIYSPDIRLFPPGTPEKIGREAVIETFKEMYSFGGTKVDISELHVLKALSDWALAKQNFQFQSCQGRLLFTAKMIHTWQKKDDKPEMTLAMWNFDDCIQLP